MEHLDYLPFLQFIRDDKETVSIMQEALTIIPKVCDFLDGNLGAFNQTLNNQNQTPSINIGETEETPRTPLPATSETRPSLPSAGNSTGSSQLKRSIHEPNTESSTPSKPYGVPPKKARLPINETDTTEALTSPPTSSESVMPTLDEVRQQLQEDYDKFVRQIGELAALEREKNRLLGKFLSVSAMASGSASSSSPSEG